MKSTPSYIKPKANSPLVIILGAFVILCAIYAWATPPLEASDELWHVGMINWIADNGQLPVQQLGVKTVYEQEGSQPPLYYLIGALLVKGVDRSDFDEVRQANPHAVAGVPGYIGNKNLVLHDTPHPALHGTVLAVFIVRFFSILCGCVTVIAIYAIAREIGVWQPILPVLAAALTAFNPMFLFISASANNDNLVTALNSVVIWQMVVMVRQSQFSVKRSFAIALLVALASLTKLSGLVVLPCVILAGMWVLLRPQFYAMLDGENRLSTLEWRGFFTFIFLIGVVWAVVAGWWYLRNITLYGELFGTQTMVAVAGPRIGGFSLQTLVDEFQGFRFAYWALFGAVNIMTFRWFYDVMDGLTVVSLLGLLTIVVVIWRSRTSWWLTFESRQILDRLLVLVLFGLIIATGTISVAVWTSQTYASQGRLLFPFNAAISILGALGLIAFGRYWLRPIAPKGVGDKVYYAITGAMAGFALIVPFTSIVPEYAPPPAVEQVPQTAHTVYARFGDVALVGYDAPDQRYYPGYVLPVTVYWEVLEPSTTDYSLYLHATLDDGSVIGKVDSYPGAGRLRTSTWQVGAIYADTYAIPLVEASDGASRLRVQVGWWDYSSKELVEAVDQNHQSVVSVMLDAGGFASAHAVQNIQGGIEIVEPIQFGGVIELNAYRLEDEILTLSWRALGSRAVNYTVFVQALDENNQLMGQGDAPPRLPTRYWQAGEYFVTQHIIRSEQSIAAGEYRVIVGWYKPDDLTRLSTVYPDNAFVLPVPLVIP